MPIGTFDPQQSSQQFLTLLVAQIQNQDPLEPAQQEDITAQLAQISTVDGINNLNLQFSELLNAETLFNGAPLAGQRVEYQLPGQVEPVIGFVEAVSSRDGRLVLQVNDLELGLADIDAVLPPLAALPEASTASTTAPVVQL